MKAIQFTTCLLGAASAALGTSPMTPLLPPQFPSPSSPGPAGGYELRSSGTCSFQITSIGQCSLAGATLRISHSPAIPDVPGAGGVSYSPPWCYFEVGLLRFNANGANSTHFAYHTPFPLKTCCSHCVRSILLCRAGGLCTEHDLCLCSVPYGMPQLPPPPPMSPELPPSPPHPPSPPSPPRAPGGFALLASGSCVQAGMWQITTPAACKRAAHAVGVPFTILKGVLPAARHSTPPNCFAYHANLEPLYFNVLATSTATCSEHFWCLCGEVPSPPSPPDPPAMPPAAPPLPPRSPPSSTFAGAGNVAAIVVGVFLILVAMLPTALRIAAQCRSREHGASLLLNAQPESTPSGGYSEAIPRASIGSADVEIAQISGAALQSVCCTQQASTPSERAAQPQGEDEKQLPSRVMRARESNASARKLRLAQAPPPSGGEHGVGDVTGDVGL
jgi:hypothetical protein